jgi:Amt family ammonium transporter
MVCSLAVGLKYKLNYDDSLDVVGVHLVGGIIGCLFIGFFGSAAVNSVGINGLFYGGGWKLLGLQALGAFSVLAYSLIVTLILGFLLQKTLGFRVSRDTELEGIDLVEHAESAYEFEGLSGGGLATGSALKTKVAVKADEEVTA